VNKDRYSAKKILLNVAIVLVGACLGLLTSVRHGYWGPEGPVGGWLLLVPYLGVVIVLVTALLVAPGIFSWVPGGRGTRFAICVGLLIAFLVSGYYSMSEVETRYERFAASFGWLLVAGCFVAVNFPPSTAIRTLVAATLGLGGIAGWVQVAVWLNEYTSEQSQLAESKIAHEQEMEDQRAAAFRALGKDAPLWNYFSYMYISNDDLRKECHEIMAARPDRDEKLVEYLDNEILASDATRYIAEFHPGPGPALAPAFAKRSDLVLSRIGEVNPDYNQLSERSYSDIQDIIRAATRIQRGGSDLTTQMQSWRDYLKRFKNTGELVAEIDQALPQPNTR
jgi:hypothetical protein